MTGSLHAVMKMLCQMIFDSADMGVLAYGKKPIPRAIPNQRFLQNTLKSVDFGKSLSSFPFKTA